MLPALLLTVALVPGDTPAVEYPAVEFYPYRQSIAKYEDAVRDFESRPPWPADAPDPVLFVGSSSFTKWRDMAEDMAPWPVLNRGFGGSKYSDVAWFADRIVRPHRFRALVLFVANDIRDGRTDKTPAEAAAFARHTLATVRAERPDVPVFFVEITPTSKRFRLWPKTRELNRLLAEIAASEPHVHFIPTADAYLNADGTPRDELFLADRLHQNAAGYAVWSGIIKRHLRAVLGDPPAAR